MTVLEAVKKSGASVFTYKGAIKAAQNMLLPSEVVLWATTALIYMDARHRSIIPDPNDLSGATPMAVVVTNERILFSYSSFGDRYSKSIQLDDILSVDDAERMHLASVRIASISSCVLIIAKKKYIADLRQALERALYQPDSNDSSYVDELKNLKELCDAGVITQEEFAAKKAQILNL